MNKVHSIKSLLPTLQRKILRTTVSLGPHRTNPIAASCLSASQTRCMSGHHDPPAHWKSMKQICLENKNHMDCMPVPEGSWQEAFANKQRKYNLAIAIGAVAFGITYYTLYKTNCLNLHSYGDYKKFKYKIGGAELLAASELDSNNNAKAEESSPGGSDTQSVPVSGEEAAEDLSQLPDVPSHAQYLLVGAGTASFGAFRAIKSRDPKAKILVIGDERFVPYMRPPLSKELWFNENKDEVEQLNFRQWNGKKRSVFYEPQEFFADPKILNSLENGGIALLSGKKVVRLDAGNKTVWLESGEKITYDKCLVATGGKPKNIPPLQTACEEVKKRTILYRNIKDFNRLTEMLESAESVAIVGGGFLGSELACALGRKARQSGLKVYQLFPEKGNMGKVLPDYLSKWTTRKVEAEGVEVIPNQSVEKACFRDGKVVLKTKEGKEVCADIVISAVGLNPNIELARSSNLEVDEVNGGFLVNAELEARRDVWVAGDAACFYDIKLGRRRVEHHDHAVVSGRLAGENMTGASKPYWHQSMFWSDLGPEVGYEAIGIVDSSLKTVAVFATASEKDTPKAVVDATGESIRSETEARAQPGVFSPKRSSPLDNEDYGKGIVFYLNPKNTVVGILLWNTFNKMSIARQVLKDGARNEDLYEVAKLFDIYETASEESQEEAKA